MTEKEQIRAEIEKWIYNTEWEVSPGKYNKSESEAFKSGWRCGLEHIREFINSLPKRNEDDALLLERAWLTLYYFEHNELAERLRDYAKRNDLVWMG